MGPGEEEAAQLGWHSPCPWRESRSRRACSVRGARPARLGGLMKPIQIDLARVADVPFWRAYELRRLERACRALIGCDAPGAPPGLRAGLWSRPSPSRRALGAALRELGLESY